jgi:hypothetical protein
VAFKLRHGHLLTPPHDAFPVPDLKTCTHIPGDGCVRPSSVTRVGGIGLTQKSFVSRAAGRSADTAWHQASEVDSKDPIDIKISEAMQKVRTVAVVDIATGPMIEVL